MSQTNTFIKESLYATLLELKENNNRDWYHANKAKVEAARAQLEALVNGLLPQVRAFDSNVGIWEAKNTLYRQARDIRFSQDKSPYKTHFAANICYGNVRDHNLPCYYIHFEDNHCMLAGGVAFPMNDNLKKIRDEIYYNFEEFDSIVKSKEIKKYFSGLDSDYCLKTAPKGYPKDCQAIDYLKHKNFIFSIVIDEQETLLAGFENRVVDIFYSMRLFNQFLFRALS
jgi:TIGR02453 family protein